MARKKHTRSINEESIRIYGERNKILRSLGFSSYGDYLASELWAGIRARVLAGARHKCETCGRYASEVHHGAYTRSSLDGRNLTKLFAICRICHEDIEFRKRDGAKLSPVEATSKLLGKRSYVRQKKNLTKQSRSEPRITEVFQEYNRRGAEIVRLKAVVSWANHEMLGMRAEIERLTAELARAQKADTHP
jgi:hypothetical protein